KLVDPTDRSGAFRGREKAYDHLVYLVKNAEKNIVLMTSKTGLERKHDLLANHLKRAAKRKVDVKIITSPNTNKTLLDDISKYSQVQMHKDSTARFCVVDNKHLMLFLTDDLKIHKSYDSAVWVEAPLFVSYFNGLFLREWRK
ncbi:MAG: hypothetical protein KJ597_02930, partial [Nanoarchaeota archaeon]|nr:hypothetical protein [Nanoarchaeota archaeon]